MKIGIAIALVVMLASCKGEEVGRDNGWKSWPRRGSVPLATDDCMTDGCLDYREWVINDELQMEEEYRLDAIEGAQG